MEIDDAITLLAAASPAQGEAWIDAGAGTGTFSRALARLLGPAGVVYAVERDRRALEILRELETTPPDAHVIVVAGDFVNDTLDLPLVAGVLAANALHFVPYDAQARALAGLAARLAQDGRVVIVEYDRDQGNRWVPFPISRARLPRLSKDAGLGVPAFAAQLPSAYGGAMYAAVLMRRDPGVVLREPFTETYIELPP